MDTTQAYESTYHALSGDRKEIRLLHIQPALQHTDPIHCSLSTAFLDHDTTDDGPHYEALSYVWGLDTHDNPVYIDGVPKPVTRNLYHALQHLRQTSWERVMWIDALCIDQRNPTERMHQVGMMRDTYERASSTTVWLGLDTRNECGLAMKFLARLGSDKILHLNPLLMPCVEVESRNILSSEITAGLKLFFDNSWWSRVWTLQEWVLSRQAVFQSGPFLLGGSIVQRALDNWNIHVHYQACCRSSITGHSEGHNLIAYLIKLFNIVNLARGRGSLRLPYIISSFRNDRNATDPRDKVYGMLGLAHGQYENIVHADYTQTIEAAFEATTIQMILQTGSLEVLSHIPSAVDPKLVLPSYVTDWTVSYDGDDHQEWLGWLRSLDLYNACKYEAASLTVVGHGCVQLKGLRVDEIDAVPSMSDIKVVPGFLDALISSVGSRDANAQRSEYQIYNSDFWTTVCGSLESFVDEGGRRIRRMSTTESQNAALFEKCVAWNQKPLSDFWDQCYQDIELQSFSTLYNSMRLGRKLLVTKSGRFAWCPRTCQKGDIITVLAGGDVPFVLRPVDAEKYRFLGDAYVHGIMDGEAVDEMYSSGRDWEDFLLV